MLTLPSAALAKTAEEVVVDIRLAEARVDQAQECLTDSCELTDYRSLVRFVDGTNVWTAALQTALNEHAVVRMPSGRYYVDGLVTVPSNRRIEAGDAVIVMLPPMETAFLRNVHAATSAEQPVDASVRDANIAIIGGVWEDWRRSRCSEGGSGKAGFPGASALFYFSNVTGLSFRQMTLVHAAAFGIQVGDAEDVVCTDLSLEKCHADGFHVNGGVKNVLARNIHGDVGDDLVALNFHDWPCSSANFGPGDTVLVENLRLREGSPWFRLLPGVKLHADGTRTDCPTRNIVVRNVRGINEFKMYMQTRAYRVGVEKHEPAEVGWGENIYFEDIELTANPEVPPFEIGANLRNVRLKDVRVHSPEGTKDPHVVSVGPKSWVIVDKNATGLNIVSLEEPSNTKARFEVFDPWVSCTVDGLAFEGVKLTGVTCAEPVHCVVFEDILKDGDSSGRGRVINFTTDNPIQRKGSRK